MFFFFFKQKTAYEMRISDWSSDVCSSDLRRRQPGRQRRPGAEQRAPGGGDRDGLCGAAGCAPPVALGLEPGQGTVDGAVAPNARGQARAWRLLWWRERSEEHTSELQSLMRISYAVFCLKKKK